MSGVSIPVRVAVRLRPLSQKELDEGCEDVIRVLEGNQVYVESTKNAFTYDWAFSGDALQSGVYETAVKNMIPNLFKGYNVTVLAYGQTGSGKTHSMGTTNSVETLEVMEGIIPRAVKDIFKSLSDDPDHSYIVRVSFIELYKESLFDLLSSQSNKKEECILDLREDPKVGVKIVNLTECVVGSLNETMALLEVGSTKRVTAATAMNNVSSRSHAIFTLHIERAKKDNCKDILLAKFHLVDLAGSERQKKTKATGERFKEGIDINKGLLALGNVIAALGEDAHTVNKHIPYRDSKLTRLLQDSLGGNSHTLMIACASPSDSNIDETLSTLRYADRARKIKNKPIVNRDGKDAELSRLRNELSSLKSKLASGGKVFEEIDSKEVEELRSRNAKLKTENMELTSGLMAVQDELAHLNEKVLLGDSVNEMFQKKLNELEVTMRSKMSNGDDINEVYSKIQEVVDIHQDSAKKLFEHEMMRNSVNETIECDGDGVESQGENSDEAAAAHVLRQNHLASQLQNLNKLLAQKEQLVTTMNQNEEKFNDMKQKYEVSIKSMESELEKMIREKDELVTSVKKEPPGNKIAEQRRKRIQELESMIQDMKKKMTEQQKVIRLNEKDKAKMLKLTNEILQMKQQKVKLVRQMKEDSEKVKVWKQQKERELTKVKAAERKNQVKIAKMENLHNKQKNVWKRKMEEVASVNAKLKSIVEKQKAAQSHKVGSGLVGSGERVRCFIQDELDVIVGYKEAVQARENLLKERTSLKSQLENCRRSLRMTLGADERKEIDKKMSDIQTEIEDRSAGIANLQKHIVDLDKVKDASIVKLDTLQTMTEAKIAVEYLFGKCSESLANLALTKADYKDLQSQNEDTLKSYSDLEKELLHVKAMHEDQVVSVSREHEEKVLFLLRQFHGSQEGEHATDIEERLKIQESEIRKMSQLNEVLIKMKDENDRLKAEVESKAFLVPKPLQKAKKPSETKLELLEDIESEGEESEEETDDENDPEWRKTPLFARIRSLKKKSISSRNDFSRNATKRRLSHDAIEEDEEEENSTEDNEDNSSASPPKTRKRNSRTGCNCRKKCNTKSCSCRKNDKSCEDCGCSPEVCVNRLALGNVTNNLTTNCTANTISILNDESLNLTEIKDENLLGVPPVTYIPRSKKRVTMDHQGPGDDQPPVTPSPKRRESYFNSPFLKTS